MWQGYGEKIQKIQQCPAQILYLNLLLSLHEPIVQGSFNCSSESCSTKRSLYASFSVDDSYESINSDRVLPSDYDSDLDDYYPTQNDVKIIDSYQLICCTSKHITTITNRTKEECSYSNSN